MNKVTVTVYKTKGGQWRWKIQAGNRRIIGASTEGYRQRTKCIANLALVTGISIHPDVLDVAAFNKRVAKTRVEIPGRKPILGLKELA